MQRGISQLRVVSQVVMNNKEGGRLSFSVFLLFCCVVGRYGFFSFFSFFREGRLGRRHPFVSWFQLCGSLRRSQRGSYRCDTGEGRGRSE